jgi:phosphoglycerate dehydrogenase-like enzyme
MPAKAKVWCILNQAGLDRVMKPERQAKLAADFDVTFNKSDKMPDTNAIARKIADYDVLLGGWGSPALTAKVFDKAAKLRLYCHCAGSVKHILSPEVVEQHLAPRNIVTFSANEAVAYNVAESTVGLMMMLSHRWVPFVNDFRATGRWRSGDIPWNGQFLQGATVGIIGASKVGRHVMKLLSGWDLKLLCYDPYLDSKEAKKLGVRLASLDALFRTADFVTLHTPSIPETNKLVNARLLKLMQDGATIINTARGNAIDHEALLAEARTGRILVGLDVTEPEPLPTDSPFRELDNVFITPHVSGAGHYGYFKIGEMGLKAIHDCLAGKRVKGAVPYARYAQLA